MGRHESILYLSPGPLGATSGFIVQGRLPRVAKLRLLARSDKAGPASARKTAPSSSQQPYLTPTDHGLYGHHGLSPSSPQAVPPPALPAVWERRWGVRQGGGSRNPASASCGVFLVQIPLERQLANPTLSAWPSPLSQEEPVFPW